MITVRFFGAARSAAGVPEIQLQPNTLEALLTELAEDNPGLRRVFAQCSYLVDGLAVHDHSTLIADGSVLDVLPPFAGG